MSKNNNDAIVLTQVENIFTLKFKKLNGYDIMPSSQYKDKKAEIVLNIINSLKSDLVKSYTLQKIREDDIEFMKLSNQTLAKVWDNKEDSIYDKFIK